MPQMPQELHKTIFPNGFENTTRKNRHRTFGEFMALRILEGVKKYDKNIWLSSEDIYLIYSSIPASNYYALSPGSFQRYLSSLRNREMISAQRISLPASYSITKRYYYNLDSLSYNVNNSAEIIPDRIFTEESGKYKQKLGISFNYKEDLIFDKNTGNIKIISRKQQKSPISG